MKAPQAPELQDRADFTSLTLRHALGRFATGVTIVSTVTPEGEPAGLTVSSFNSLSLEPPLVLWSLRRSSHNLPVFCAAPFFAVNVLTEKQVELSRAFAAKAPHRFGDGEWERDEHGLPLLRGAAARFVCANHAHQEAGDHELFIGRVLRLSHNNEPPLLFEGGRYHRLGAAI